MRKLISTIFRSGLPTPVFPAMGRLAGTRIDGTGLRQHQI